MRNYSASLIVGRGLAYGGNSKVDLIYNVTFVTTDQPSFAVYSKVVPILLRLDCMLELNI